MSRAMKVRLLALAIPLLFWHASANAAITTATYYFNQSNEFADGINYGSIFIEANDGAGIGTVKFTVTATTTPYTSLLTNFGLQTFGFNPVLTAGTTYTFDGPDGWTLTGSGNEDGFGTYMENTAGGGGNRVNPLVFTLTLSDATQAVASNFASLNGGQAQYFFAAHVADITVDGSTKTSHYIAGSTTIPPPPPIEPPGVPEPTSLAVWCLGMVAAGIGARRMRRGK